MGLTGSAGIPPTSAFGRSSRVNVSACSEPILFSRGGSSFTVIKGPPGSISVKLTLARLASGFGLQPWAGGAS
jgi:hypothetical protein